MNRLLSILLLFCVYSHLYAQTPYDAFASEVSRPILDVVQNLDAYNDSLQLSPMAAPLATKNDVSKWLSPDPLSNKYPEISPYAYCHWNPVKYIDPDGRWIAVTSNDDIGTSYKVVGGAVEVNDCNVYIVGNDYNTKNDGKPSNVEILGQTVTPFSFCNEKGEVKSGSTINMNDKSGDAFIARFQNDEVPLISYILPPILSNESGWPNGGCDFKSGDNPNRGMPLTILGGKIGTARDIGNFAAGFLAASNGITGRTTRTVFDVFQNLTTTGCTTGEPPVSWWAQQLGQDYGRASRFVNRVCQPNIYNAYR